MIGSQVQNFFFSFLKISSYFLFFSLLTAFKFLSCHSTAQKHESMPQQSVPQNSPVHSPSSDSKRNPLPEVHTSPAQKT